MSGVRRIQSRTPGGVAVGVVEPDLLEPSPPSETTRPLIGRLITRTRRRPSTWTLLVAQNTSAPLLGLVTAPLTLAIAAGALCVLGLLSVLSLIPSWPLKTAPADVPAFFTSGAVDRIPYGSVALISPYPSVAEVQPQLWQAISTMRFRIIGGYALVAGPGSTPTNFPQVLRPPPVERFLWAKATGGAAYPAGPVPKDGPVLVCQLRSFLRRYRVASVISTAAEAEPGPIDALYAQAIGPQSYVGGGVTACFGVRDAVVARVSPCETR